jgi:hypothetical protein
MRCLLVTLTLLISAYSNLFSQNNGIKKGDATYQWGENWYEINNRTYNFRFGQTSIPSVILTDNFLEKRFNKYLDPKTGFCTYDGLIRFNHCIFNTVPGCERYGSSYPISGQADISLYNCNINNNSLFSNGSLDADSCTFKGIISLTSAEMDVQLQHCTVRKSLDISRAVIRSFRCRDVNFENNSSISFSWSTINYLDMYWHQEKTSKTRIGLSTDTLNGSFSSSGSFTFYNCLINSDMSINRSQKSLSGTKVMFEFCKFGRNASLSALNVDTLVFDNCLQFESPVFLLRTSPGICQISFKNTDVDKIVFDYSPSYKLFLARKGVSPEEVTNTYEWLISKFKREGKTASHKEIDIEYRRYRYSKKFGGIILDFLDRNWWYYGYEPNRVFSLMLLFVGLFYLVNVVYWNKVRLVYNVIPFVSSGWHQQSKRPIYYNLKRLITILVFTCLVFFSIYINFDKLSFDKTRWLVWFFLQYIIGLFFLFFIVNAILKF